MLKTKAEKCRKSTDSKSCLAKITNEITTFNVKIWKSVDNLDEIVNDYCAGVIKQLGTCGTTAINNYQNKLDIIADKISDCIAIIS